MWESQSLSSSVAVLWPKGYITVSKRKLTVFYVLSEGIMQVHAGQSDVSGKRIVHGQCKNTSSKPLPSRSRGRREQCLTIPTGQEIHSSWAHRLGGTGWFFAGTQSSSPNVNLIINQAGSQSEGDPERSLVSPVNVFISEVAIGEDVPHLALRHSHWALQSKSSSERQCPHFPAGLPQTANHRTRWLPGALETWGLMDSATSHTETSTRWWNPRVCRPKALPSTSASLYWPQRPLQGRIPVPQTLLCFSSQTPLSTMTSSNHILKKAFKEFN